MLSKLCSYEGLVGSDTLYVSVPPLLLFISPVKFIVSELSMVVTTVYFGSNIRVDFGVCMHELDVIAVSSAVGLSHKIECCILFFEVDSVVM
ncbi:Hypothetical protein J6896_04090 [Nakaseomyces glabratus]